MAVFSDTSKDKLLLYSHQIQWIQRRPLATKADPQVVLLDSGEPLRREIEHFMECVSTRRTPLSDGAHGMKVLEVLLGCDESIARGNVWWPLSAKPEPQFHAHETAVVDGGAIVGKGTRIWHFCHVMKGARLGDKCILGQNVFIASDVKVGNNVKIQNNVSVYTGTEIEDDVFLGPACALTNVINPRSEVVRHSLYERTLLRRGCTIGANATIVCGTTVGRYAFVGAGAVVTKDVPDYALMVGVPARRKGWISRHGVPLPAPGLDGVMTCRESGLRYQEVEPGILICLDLPEDTPLPPQMRKGEKPYRMVKSAQLPQ